MDSSDTATASENEIMSTFSQVFPPAPTFTEKDTGSLNGKVGTVPAFPARNTLTYRTSQVFIVTGAASGVGYELAKMLYGQGGAVYIAARSAEKVDTAIKKIKASAPSSKGRLAPLLLDLADFPTIKKAANEFLKKEDRLDVLVHNAGLMTPPTGSKNKLVIYLIIRSWSSERR